MQRTRRFQAGFQCGIFDNPMHGAVAILHNTVIAYLDRDRLLHLDTGGYATRATNRALNTFLAIHPPTQCFTTKLHKGIIYINYKSDSNQWQQALNPRLTIDLNLPLDTSTSVYINPNTGQR